MPVFTIFGSLPAVIVVVAMVAAWALRGEARAVAGVLAAVASEGHNLLLTLAFRRPRPDLLSEVTAPRSCSFPSGHAMVAAAV